MRILYFIVPVFTALAVLRHFFIPVRVHGRSMRPRFEDGAILLARRCHTPDRFDIVITKYPDRRGLFIKRVIGLPGETVSARRGVVFINGEPLVEPFEKSLSMRFVPETALGADEYFVMGDNRAVSRDSRDRKTGAIPRRLLRGRMIREVYMPQADSIASKKP